ncbi:uncharacterized protein PODANS_1_2530 [Podospora anserina S mat+]|uniref:Podospora anserina S mat+ genomic DNA chromosome 1, supercontig 1 n=1 Tax=Podospora anserina (strain S / ATCC MYA-4624 / DSM 980 / FGSC 10383) TaxID=515849 RepID=B2AA19_PODAN|nr:uncharacterized protein PODANS_1_2530 [Podospora anserina S mat+]CAP59930.1 unnamed protein product [Podospora anserina S mat+]
MGGGNVRSQGRAEACPQRKGCCPQGRFSAQEQREGHEHHLQHLQADLPLDLPQAPARAALQQRQARRETHV